MCVCVASECLSEYRNEARVGGGDWALQLNKAKATGFSQKVKCMAMQRPCGEESKVHKWVLYKCAGSGQTG